MDQREEKAEELAQGQPWWLLFIEYLPGVRFWDKRFTYHTFSTPLCKTDVNISFYK